MKVFKLDLNLITAQPELHEVDQTHLLSKILNSLESKGSLKQNRSEKPYLHRFLF